MRWNRTVGEPTRAPSILAHGPLRADEKAEAETGGQKVAFRVEDKVNNAKATGPSAAHHE
jgi:hypothetical protein